MTWEPVDTTSLNTDEIIALLKSQENEGAEHLTPVAYAKIRPIHAPYLYNLIKNHKLPTDRCQCGRLILNVDDTDRFFKARRKDWPYDPDEGEEDA